MPAAAEWVGQLLAKLQEAGPVGQATVSYISDHRIRIGVRRQSAGARWTAGRAIELHPRYVDGRTVPAYPMSLVVHEVRHLQQGWLTALSVYGELDAWQQQFKFLQSVNGPHGEAPDHSAVIAALLLLPLGWNRSVLRTARQLMRSYAGRGYRIDLLPLYPLHRELIYRFLGRHAGN